jgi:pyridoxamine 5'-phosphate oxidase
MSFEVSTTNIFDEIWSELSKACAERHAFTTLTLATVDAKNAPQARTIILRGAQSEQGEISFATDIRSQKCADITANNRVALTGYDSTRSIQLRLAGRASINRHESERQAAFSSLKPHTHYLFTSSQRPGTAITSPSEIHFVSDEQRISLAAYENFGWVTVEIDQIERLDLRQNPHQRIGFAKHSDEWLANWLVA